LEYDSLNVLVIGGSSSIGEALIDKFLGKDGASILSTYNSVGRKINIDNVVERHLDLSSIKSIDEFVDFVVTDIYKLDIVIFTSGILPGQSLNDYNEALINDVMSINFSSQALLLHKLLPYLSTDAHVIFISSISADRGSFDPIYAASKGAINAFIKSLSTWLAPNLRVNGVAPSLIEGSRMFADMTPERREHHRLTSPLKRLVTKEEVAGVIFDMCGPSWASVNGQIISINGGVYP